MSYKNKVYVSMDADNDLRYYYLMKAWKQNDNTDFNFYDAHDLNNNSFSKYHGSHVSGRPCHSNCDKAIVIKRSL